MGLDSPSSENEVVSALFVGMFMLLEWMEENSPYLYTLQMHIQERCNQLFAQKTN